MSGYSVSTSETNLAKFAIAIQQLYAGRSNANGTVTLAASATSTVVTATNCAAGSSVSLNPTTANAAAALSTTYSIAGNGVFTVHHASNTQTDRTFTYACFG